MSLNSRFMPSYSIYIHIQLGESSPFTIKVTNREVWICYFSKWL